MLVITALKKTTPQPHVTI